MFERWADHGPAGGCPAVRALAVVGVVALAGCQALFPTEAAGPQRVVVRDLATDQPIAGAEVEYEFLSFGPRADIEVNRHGQIEVRPRLPMPSDETPPAKPMPSLTGSSSKTLPAPAMMTSMSGNSMAPCPRAMIAPACRDRVPAASFFLVLLILAGPEPALVAWAAASTPVYLWLTVAAARGPRGSVTNKG